MNTLKTIVTLAAIAAFVIVFARSYLVDHGMTGEAGRIRRYRRRMQRRPGAIVAYTTREVWSDGRIEWRPATSYARDGLELEHVLGHVRGIGARDVRIVMETRDQFGAAA